jgi:hypothetical protein
MTEGDGMRGATTDVAAAETCWLCGYRQSAAQMIADGGSACPDIRWYCLDMLSCTQRWIRLRAELAVPRQGTPAPLPAGGELTGPARAIAAPGSRRY